MAPDILTKKMITATCVFAAIFIVTGAALYRSIDSLWFAFGVLLGSACNVAKIILLNRAVDKAIKMDQKAAGDYIRIQYVFRLAVTIAVLLASHYAPFLNLYGAAAGIFTMQFATIAAKIASKKKPPSAEEKGE